MYESEEISQRQILSNGDNKITTNKFTKTLTSFHTKNYISKNTPKETSIKKLTTSQNKSTKSKKIYFSSKKKNSLGYIVTNPFSPINNFKTKGIYNKNPIITTNVPNSAQRVYDHKNGYILNNINKYQTNIIDNKRKDNKSSSLNEKIIKKYENNLSNNNSKNISKKTNGASNNIINNSLIRSSENFLNTIAITSNNNENNINGGLYTYKYNISQNNLNDLNISNSRSKIIKKEKEKNKSLNNNKKINLNQNKKNSLKKAKTNSKLKSDITKKSNKSSSNQNNNSSSMTNSNNNTYKNKDNDKVENRKTQNENEKLDYIGPKILNTNRKSYNNFNINRYDLFYQTIENKNINENILNDGFNFQSTTYTNNTRNKQNKKEIINYYNKTASIDENKEENKTANNNNNNYLTNNSVFEKSKIKVNIIDKNTFSDNNNQKGIYTKNNINNNEMEEEDYIESKILTEQNSERKVRIVFEKHSPKKKNIFMNNINTNKPKEKISNLNIYPLSSEYNHAYVKKKSSDSSLKKNTNKANNGNPLFLTNKKAPFVNHSKNNSVSNNINIGNTQRSTEDKKISPNIIGKEIKSEYLYTSKNNSARKNFTNKSIVVPEYSIKLENIKSRVSNLLNVYSLLALRGLNDTNDLRNDNTNKENKNS